MPLRTVAGLPMRLKAVGLLIAFAASSVTVGAQGSEPAWQLIGQIGGPTEAIATHGKYAYVGVGQRLTVLDVSTPTTPLEVGSSAPFADSVRDIAVSGSIAYVAAGGDGLRVLDVSNPASPAEIGSLHVRGYAEGVAIAGTTVCLADGPYGLRVIDASNPANLTEVGSAFTRNYAFKVAMAGSYAYVAAAGAGLLIADLTNPARPVEVATLATPGYAYGVTISGNTAYVAGGWEGLSIVDIATTTAPRLLGQYKTRGWAFQTSISGTQAYVAAALGGLSVLDVSNPAQPSEIGSFAVDGGDAASVALAGNIAYVADRNWGVEAVDVSAPASPSQVGFYGPLGWAADVIVAGNYAYVAAGSYGLRILDISDPANPRQVGTYDAQGYAQSVAVFGTYAYLGTMVGASPALQVVDVSDPSRPARAASSNACSPTRRLIAAAGIVYLADEHGLCLIDVSDPKTPKQLSFLNTSSGNGTAVGVAVSGSLAYVAYEQGGLLVADVSNPSSPVIVGRVQWPGAFAENVVVVGSTAFVVDNCALTTLDVSAPSAPVWLTSVQKPACKVDDSLAVVDNQAFVPSGGAGLAVFDVSKPNSPALLWRYPAPGSTNSVFVDRGYAFVANWFGGLLVLAGPQAQPHADSVSDRAMTSKSAPPPRVRASVEPMKSTPASYPAQTASSCVVTSTADSGSGTLRNCLSGASSGTTITFDPLVFPPDHPATSAPLSPLPDLGRGSTTIDASNAGVILDGSSLNATVSGLTVASDGNTIKGLQILHFSDNGISVLPNARDNVIGGSRNRGTGPLGEGNLISGNGFCGILIAIGVTNTTIVGNFIGTDVTGAIAMGNRYGIILSGGINNRIGGYTPDERNVISGNSGDGVTTNVSNSPGNKVIGNYIGVDASGTHALPNSGDAIGLSQGGNDTLIQGNVIVPSNGNCIGIDDWGSSYNSIVGNLIGTDASGTIPLGGSGICINIGEITSFNRIGGLTPADRNVIAGEVDLSGSGALAIGNFIGTDVSGTTAFARAGVGLGTGRLFLGGTAAAERNVIRGGVKTGLGSDYSFVGGNYIGTDASGREAGSRGPTGVSISQGAHVFVQGNLIAGDYSGVIIDGGGPNTLRQNLIYDHPGGGIVLSNGANAGISPPVVTAVGLTVVSGTACPGCEVEIFSDSGDEGQFFEGSTIAGVAGAFQFVGGAPLVGPNITATATDSDGNTSSFSTSLAVSPPVIAVAPATLEFTYTLGAPIPAAQSIQVANSGGGALNWSASTNAAWLSASPASGAAPSTLTVSVAPTGLAAGTYNGNITISASAMASQTIAVTLTVSTPVVSISAVVSAASPQSALVPGSLAVATGKFGLSGAYSASGAPLPASLGGLSLQFASGVRAPLLYASASQVDFQVPWELAGQPQSLLTASLYGGTGVRTVSLAQFAPAIFSVNGGGSGQGAIVDTSNELANAGNPAVAGSTIIVIYCTGLGPVTNRPATGAAAPSNPLAATTTTPAVTMGGVAAQVVSSNLTPGYVGLYQIEAQVSASAPTGDAVPVTISIGGATSNTVTMAVRASGGK